MSKITLLNGITEEKGEVLQCFNPLELKISKGEILTDFSDLYTQEKLYIVEEGKAHLVCLDPDGHNTILETYKEDDIFGKLFLSQSPGLNFSVIAADNCKVLQLDYHLICRCCEKPCPYHAVLLSNLFRISVNKNALLTAHLNILSQRTIRTKLLCFFDFVSEGKSEFEIPYKISELADYLCIDRCAMLRELKKMKEEGIVYTKGRFVQFPDRKQF